MQREERLPAEDGGSRAILLVRQTECERDAGLAPGIKRKAPYVRKQAAAPKLTPAQQAQGALLRGDYDEALQLVQNADRTSPEELANVF